MMFYLTAAPILRDDLIQGLKNDKAGALVVFEGWVRDHNQGKSVFSLEYQVYEALAQKEGEKILQEAIHKFNLHKALCSHRHGHLKLGDIAVCIGAVASHRDDAFKATRYIIDEIKLRLPIWKKEHYLNESPVWVFCKDHHTHVHFHEQDYYQKQKTVTAQQTLKDSRVLVVGAGGLGCPVLTSLTSAGVGHIDFVDFDVISISNIHRQPLYSPDVVGEKKVTVAQNKLSTLNPFIHVHGKDVRVTAANVEHLIQGKSLVLDCADNLATKFLLHDACFRHQIPLISASIHKFDGYIRTFDPKAQAGCLRCTQEVTPKDNAVGNCNDFGVLGASVAALGSLQANEALAFLANKTNTTIHETFYLDLKNLRTMKIRNFKKENCSYCAGLRDIAPEDVLDQEFEINPEDLDLEKMHLLDIRNLEDDCLHSLQNDSRTIVVCCHRGIRSLKLVKEQRRLGHTQFYSLKGGAPCSL